MTGCLARALGGLILLGWPWALGIGWLAWLIAIPWYAILGAAVLGAARKDAPPVSRAAQDLDDALAVIEVAS